MNPGFHTVRTGWLRARTSAADLLIAGGLFRATAGLAQVEYVDRTIGGIGCLLEPTRPTVSLPNNFDFSSQFTKRLSPGFHQASTGTSSEPYWSFLPEVFRSVGISHP